MEFKTLANKTQAAIEFLEKATNFDSIETAEVLLKGCSTALLRCAEDLHRSEKFDEDAARVREWNERLKTQTERVSQWVEAEKERKEEAASIVARDESEKYKDWIEGLKNSDENLKDFVPEVTHEKLNPIQERILNLLIRATYRQPGEQPPAVFLRGPAGGGKTSLPRILAAHLGVPFVKLDCGSIETAKDIWGAPTLDTVDGKLCKVWEDSVVTKAVESDTWCVVLIDEANRFINPHAGQNALGPLLDGQGTIYADKMKTVRPKNCWFFTTANVGDGHMATNDLDAMFYSRHGAFIDVEHPDSKELYKNFLHRKQGSKAPTMIDPSSMRCDVASTVKKLAAAFDELMAAVYPPSPGRLGRREFLNTCFMLEGATDQVEINTAITSCLVYRYDRNDEFIDARALVSDILKKYMG